ncbi:MAG: histidine phosphatase family protein [Calditrichaeota bacterium]|nr:MAG: histidine phosphatase family protein [Calditrichota bacterium]
MKTLYIMRHGKSSWEAGAQNDFDRPLNTRGKRDVLRMAKALHDRNARPDIIITSPAVRALTTARLLCASVQFPMCHIKTLDILYMAPAHTLLSLINSYNDHWNEVIQVGHNPGLTQLVNYFLNDRLDNLPTAAVMALRANVDSWQAFTSGTVHEVFYLYPKGLPEL